jgi:hypothetical protein
MSEQPQHPFPWRITALVSAIVIIATVIAGVILSSNSVEQSVAPTPSPSASDTQDPDPLAVDGRRQVTLLLQVRDKGTGIASSVLIGVAGGTGFVSELMLPRDLLLPTVPPVRLRDTNGPRGPITAQDPLQVLLGVQVDAAIALDRLAWAGLIDSGGELTNPDKGEEAAVFPLVLDRVLRGLPADERTIGQLLTSLGSMAPTSVTNEDASHLLHLIAEGLREQQVKRVVLPITYVRGGSRPVAVMDQPAAGSVLADLFPQAMLQTGHSGTTRVLIQQAGASLGRVAQARQALAQAGLGVTLGLPGTAVAPTAIYVPEATQEALRLGRDAATALGLPATAVKVDARPGPVVDVRVVLGSDYAPV